MRRLGMLSSAFGLCVFSFGLFAVGCFDSFSDEHCDLSARCGPPNTQTSTSSSSSSSTGAPAQCIPSMAETAVDNSCGIFVSAALGNDTNTGSKASPVGTLGKAIALASAQGKPVYVCNESFSEQIEVPAGMEVFGGLDCMNAWTWSDAGRTTLQGAADQIPLKLIGGAGTTKLENFSVKAADAVAEGGSSIAAVVDQVTAEISRCDFAAGTARNGADGVQPAMAGADGSPGLPGSDACKTDPAEVMGGNGGLNDCGLEGMSMGGKGGASSADMMAVDGMAGTDGTPPDPLMMGGKGGMGGTITMMTADCTDGTKGANGEAGMGGEGGTEVGMISVAGISGGDGKNGGDGKPGQGGGGGGGAIAASFCAANSFGSGPSGGGGGAGGCGGPGGPGGKAGGSSIAMISLGATITFTQATLTSGNAGKGGNGALGQVGGQGGSGGNPGSKLTQPKLACVGGKGGIGGDGASGGGGRGGHSIGLAHKGAAPVLDGVTITTGSPGALGTGGGGFLPGQNGIDGQKANTIAF